VSEAPRDLGDDTPEDATSESPGGDPQVRANDQRPVLGAARPMTSEPEAPRVKRPILERIGLAFIALVLASLFGAVAAAAWTGGELFLAAMGAIGCVMTLWVGGLTLFRG
jgi:hypothetical protein